MNLNVSYSANALATAPQAFFNAVSYVVNLFDVTFTNNIAVNIEVGYGDFPEDHSVVAPLGESDQNGVDTGSYAQVRNALLGQAAPGSGVLPASAPIGGTLWLPTAQEKALGIIPDSATLDGWIGIASNTSLQAIGASWSFNPNVRPSATQYDVVGTLEHEFSEVMGRTSYLDGAHYGVIDLYRYKAPNLRQLSAAGNPSYFSTDNGVTIGDYWNNQSLKLREDLADWAPSGPGGAVRTGPDAFLSESPGGQINGLTQVDLILMQALGWTVGPAPTVTSVVPSGTGIVNGTGTLGIGMFVTFIVNMSQAVTVANGTPALMLNDGGIAIYTGGSGSNALSFSYQVAAGQNTSDLAVTGVSLNGARINNAAGQPADLSAAIINPDGTLVIDTSVPGNPTPLVTLAANASYIATQPNLTIQGGGGTTSVDLQAIGSLFLGDAGTDLVTVSGSNSSIIGSSGSITVNASAVSAQVTGGGGTTRINVVGGATTVHGGSGSLTVEASGSGSAVVFGGSSPLFFSGSSAAATVVAGARSGVGADTIFANGGGEFYGGSGSMLFVGGPRLSTVIGGAGNSTLFGGSSGRDLLVAGLGPTTLVGANGNVLVGLGASTDVLIAGPGSETLVGSGGGGSDIMFANSGNDAMFAGNGNDTFVASSGTAQMAAGPGADLFIFVKGAVGGTNTIWNFSQGQDHVALFGYGTGVVPNLINAAVVNSGGTTITLSDNTHLTFGNLTHLTTNDILAG
jgi:hypothetical protein